jgi:hypothetical protein
MTADKMVLVVLVLKIVIDSAASASFWRTPAQALMFFGFVVCDVAAVWIKYNARP